MAQFRHLVGLDSQRIGHADVAFTMRQYVQADLEADRQVANTLAELIIGGSLSIRGPRDRARLHRRHYRGVSRIPLAE
jgi:hypothetical protein